MHRNPFFLVLALGGASLAARADEAVIPAGTAVERYRPIWTRSPFTLASAAEPQASADWSLAGLAENGEDPLVFLVNRKTQDRMIVTGHANEQGFSIESIDYRTDLLQSSVRVKTPSDTLTVRFDPSALVASAPPASPTAPGNPPTAAGPTPMPFPVSAPHRQIMPHIVIPNPLPGNQAPRPAAP